MGIDDVKFEDDPDGALDPALLVGLDDLTEAAVVATADVTPSPLGTVAKKAMYAGIRFTGYESVMRHVVTDPLNATPDSLKHGADAGHMTFNPAIFPGALEQTGTPTAVDFKVGPAFEVVSDEAANTPVELPVVMDISAGTYEAYVIAAIKEADTDPADMEVKFDEATASPPPGVPTYHEADLKTVFTNEAARPSAHPTVPVEPAPAKPVFPFRFKKG